MPSYLLTWNPERYEWDDFLQAISDVERDGSSRFTWSCGRNTRLRRGDRVYLLRQGRADHRGLIGSGAVVWDAPRPDIHWPDRRTLPERTTMYVEVEWDVLRSTPLVSRAELDRAPFVGANWNTQISGITIPDTVSRALARVWAKRAGEAAPLPEEIDATTYPEGGVRQITVNAYERNARARRDCIAHYGAACVVCDADFSVLYGPDAAGLIHVHHVVPVSAIREQYEVDPVKDLRPVCPNCHAVIHRRMPPYSVEEVAKMYRAAAARRTRQAIRSNKK